MACKSDTWPGLHFSLSEQGQKDIYITMIVHTQCIPYTQYLMYNSVETHALAKKNMHDAL